MVRGEPLRDGFAWCARRPRVDDFPPGLGVDRSNCSKKEKKKKRRCRRRFRAFNNSTHYRLEGGIGRATYAPWHRALNPKGHPGLTWFAPAVTATTCFLPTSSGSVLPASTGRAVTIVSTKKRDNGSHGRNWRFVASDDCDMLIGQPWRHALHWENHRVTPDGRTPSSVSARLFAPVPENRACRSGRGTGDAPGGLPRRSSVRNRRRSSRGECMVLYGFGPARVWSRADL